MQGINAGNVHWDVVGHNVPEVCVTLHALELQLMMLVQLLEKISLPLAIASVAATQNIDLMGRMLQAGIARWTADGCCG